MRGVADDGDVAGGGDPGREGVAEDELPVEERAGRGLLDERLDDGVPAVEPGDGVGNVGFFDPAFGDVGRVEAAKETRMSAASPGAR